jgi:hypothetical protein
MGRHCERGRQRSDRWRCCLRAVAGGRRPPAGVSSTARSRQQVRRPLRRMACEVICRLLASCAPLRRISGRSPGPPSQTADQFQQRPLSCGR